MLDLSAHAIGGASIRLRKEFASALPPLDCDPEQLKQVLLNLVINAIQAMPEGGEVAVSARLAGGRLLIEVRGEGCGIPAENLERIFDPFFTTKEHGSGLGLSVAHQIVEQHGGTLSARANPEGGMTFSVLLPLEARGQP